MKTQQWEVEVRRKKKEHPKSSVIEIHQDHENKGASTGGSGLALYGHLVLILCGRFCSG